jgi:DHA3 family tetracycline resistance protein-like MFS transporter
MSVGWPAARVYYSLVVASAFSPFTVLAVYFVRVVHMSPLELVLTGTVMEATIFVFEVPTGAFADTFGRKRSVVFAYLLEGAAIVVVGLVPSFPAIAAAWALWGFGYTFESGSKEAWLADEVGPDRFGGVLMRASRIGSAASILGLLAGVAIALASLRAAVVFGGAVTILAGVLALVVMPETAWRRRPPEVSVSPARELARVTGAAARYARARPAIVLLVAAALVTGASKEAFDRLWEAHFIRDVGLPAVGSLDPVVWFGLFGIALSVIGILTSTLLIRRLEHAPSERLARTLLWATTVSSGAAVAFGLATNLALALCALLTAQAMRNVVGPVYSAWLNRQITDSSVRATVLSIVGQADAVGEAGGGPGLGVLGNVFGIRIALAAGGLLLAPAVGLYARAAAHHGREPELEALPLPG